MIVALCWSGFWTFGKLAVASAPPIEIATVRFILAGALMLAIAIVTRSSLGLTRWPVILVAAFFGIFVYNILVFVALTLAPASDGALIVPTLNPVLIAVFAAFIGERVTAYKIGGLVLATIGSALIIGAATGLRFSGDRIVADVMYLGCAATWALYATLGAVMLRSGSPIGVTAVASLAGAAMLFPFGFLEHGYSDIPSWTFTTWLEIAYLVVFATTVGFVLFYWAVRRFGAGAASLASYLVPVFALVQAVLILGEQPAPLEILGAAVILLGVRLAAVRSLSPSGIERSEPA